MTLLDHALAIAATGLPVFPCGTDKAPVCAGGFKVATCDPGRIRSLFAHSAAVMIGMPTGAASGVIVVDIDPRHDGNDWLEAHRAELPATRIHGTMSGGVHLLFNDGGLEIRNSAGKAVNGRKQGIAPGVDVRGNGGYVVIPPSPGYTMADEAPIADMPAWLVSLCRKPPEAEQTVLIERAVRPWIGRATTGKTSVVDDASPYGRAALESAANEIRNAYEGSKHETINRVGYSIGGLVAAGELLEGDAFRELSSALEAIRPACKNFRAAQQTLSRSFNEGRGRPRDVPERATVVEEVHPAALFLSRIDSDRAAIQRASAAKPLPVAANLMDVGGALQMFIDYCEVTAISPQPFLALAAGIAAIGALAGRKYRTKTNLRTNIYAVGVADSGGGKDHARKAIKNVFSAAQITGYMGGEDIASGTAMMTALNRHPCVLFQIDEFGDWLGDVLGPKSAPHRKQIAQRLKTLYSAAGSFVSGTEYADQSRTGKPREDIQQPHACLYGTTTPGQFWRAIADASLEDGLLARFLIFVSPESYPDERDALFIDPPAALVAAFKAIAEGPANPGTGELGRLMLANTAPEPVLVEMTPQAEAAYKTMRLHQLERVRKHAGTYVTSIAGRLAENATKLALVRAVSRDSRYPTITEHDVAWGRALAEHCIDTLLREADDNVADTPYARNMQAAKKIIRKHGPMTQYEMVRKGWAIPQKDREEILRTLLDSDQIAATMTGGGAGKGRATLRYSIGVAA
jgi:hypothetical protein